MTANIFISFASKDVKMAMTLCTALENRGYKCWISARDIQPGENFQVAIVQAIRHAKIMLLVFTANSNNSEEMTKELALASQQKMIVIPLRVEDVTPSDAFAYEFATRQWIDFFADWEFAIEQLARRIANALRDRSAGLDNNDASEALTSLAGVAPVAYNIEGPPKAPDVPPVKAPEPPKAAEPVKPAPIEAKIVEPPRPIPPPEPIKSAGAKPAGAESSAVEVREEILAALKPGAKPAAAAAAAPAGKAEQGKAPPVKPPPPVKAKADTPEGDKPAGGNRKVMVLVGVAVLALIGIGLAVPAIMRANRAPAPAEVAPTPPQAPTVVALPVPEPTAVNAVATNALATNAIATGPSATNAAATNAPAAPRPRRKVETVKTPKDDIPF